MNGLSPEHRSGYGCPEIQCWSNSWTAWMESFAASRMFIYALLRMLSSMALMVTSDLVAYSSQMTSLVHGDRPLLGDLDLTLKPKRLPTTGSKHLHIASFIKHQTSSNIIKHHQTSSNIIKHQSFSPISLSKKKKCLNLFWGGSKKDHKCPR